MFALGTQLLSFFCFLFLGPATQVTTTAFYAPSSPSRRQHQLLFSTSTAEDEVRSMTVRELKKELRELGQPTNDVFEKDELVQRLFQARQRSSNNSKTNNNSKPPSSTNVLEVPLYLTSTDSNTRVAAVNDADLTFVPSEQPYATIHLTIPGSNDRPLNLVLDTACSGFVLRPEVLDMYPNLPKLSTPVTMTGAGGTGAATGLTQLQSFQVGGQTFGPLPAAVQDIGALPASLDGILGLSFLQQFAAFEMDFSDGVVRFYRNDPPPPQDRTVVADANLRRIGSLGIYAVPVYLGSRGPVDLLLDTGAACTLLSWKGVGDLGLSAESPAVKPLSTSVGAMGSDNIAMQLTHRLHVSSTLKLGNTNQEGLSLAEGSRLPIDIGRITLLESLASQGVGGILGVDALMRCAAVRISCQGSPQTVTLLVKTTEKGKD